MSVWGLPIKRKLGVCGRILPTGIVDHEFDLKIVDIWRRTQKGAARTNGEKFHRAITIQKSSTKSTVSRKTEDTRATTACLHLLFSCHVTHIDYCFARAWVFNLPGTSHQHADLPIS